MTFSREEFGNALEVLEGDLVSLGKLVFPHQRPVSLGDIRLASVILRKYLPEGLLGRLCNSPPERLKATLPALNNKAVIDEITKRPDIRYFLTGGIQGEGGRSIEGINESTRPAGTVPLLPIDSMHEEELSLSEFMNQKRVYFEGEFFSCNRIITFVANKLGGAHLDFKRGNDDRLERAANHMTYGGPPEHEANPPGELYYVLEPNSTEVMSGLHIEIIAAAASLVQVRLNGRPLVQISIHRPLKGRLKDIFGKRRPPFKMYERPE